MDRKIAGNFDEYGFPYLNLKVCNKKKGLSVDAKAIIDTGGAHCLVQKAIAAQLQLEELRIADYRHPVFGKMPLQEYIMDLRLGDDSESGGATIEGIRAGTLIDPHYPAAVVIGVEVLQHCKLEYNGPDKTFTITLIL